MDTAIVWRSLHGTEPPSLEADQPCPAVTPSLQATHPGGAAPSAVHASPATCAGCMQRKYRKMAFRSWRATKTVLVANSLLAEPARCYQRLQDLTNEWSDLSHRLDRGVLAILSLFMAPLSAPPEDRS